MAAVASLTAFKQRIVIILSLPLCLICSMEKEHQVMLGLMAGLPIIPQSLESVKGFLESLRIANNSS
jgi:hypothetical protein